MNKKLIIILCSVIGFLVLLILIVWLITVFKPTYYSYETVETKIIKATSSYYKNHPELLPVDDGKYTLDYSVLVEEGLIKPLNEILKDGDNCNATIYTIKEGVNYDYVPFLNCGDNYQTRELYKQVLKDNPVVTDGSGLYYSENGEYYFRGKIENNYVVLGTYENSSNKRVDLVWQIISIGKDNTIRMQATKRLASKTAYDTRYNINKDQRVGYNDFEPSELKSFLIKQEDDKDMFQTKEKVLLVAQNLCIAPRKMDDTSKDGSTECSVKSSNKMLFSTILPYEYLRASLDVNCKSMNDTSCINYNYLVDDYASSRWSITANPIDTYHAYRYSGEGFTSTTASTEKNIFLVTNLNEFAIYKEGNGTLENPYRLFRSEKK